METNPHGFFKKVSITLSSSHQDVIVGAEHREREWACQLHGRKIDWKVLMYMHKFMEKILRFNSSLAGASSDSLDRAPQRVVLLSPFHGSLFTYADRRNNAVVYWFSFRNHRKLEQVGFSRPF